MRTSSPETPHLIEQYTDAWVGCYADNQHLCLPITPDFARSISLRKIRLLTSLISFARRRRWLCTVVLFEQSWVALQSSLGMNENKSSISWQDSMELHFPRSGPRMKNRHQSLCFDSAISADRIKTFFFWRSWSLYWWVKDIMWRARLDGNRTSQAPFSALVGIFIVSALKGWWKGIGDSVCFCFDLKEMYQLAISR